VPFDYELTDIKTDLEILRLYGYPSEINKLLRLGKVDVSPISSAEYIENPERYLVFPNLSISSKNKVLSVAIFSNKPIEEVKNIYLSTQSKTSRLLTKIVMKKFFNLEVNYKDLISLEQSYDGAVLLIGDDAIKYLDRFNYYYDLAEIWYRETGLPFVFALWSVNRDAFNKKRNEILRFYKILKESRDKFLSNVELFLDKIELDFDKNFVKKYINSLDYFLFDKHIESIELFNKYLLDVGILKKKNKLKFII